jgi:hypothetical protein
MKPLLSVSASYIVRDMFEEKSSTSFLLFETEPDIADLPLRIILNPSCLVTLEVCEYSTDWQGGDWPISHQNCFRGERHWPELESALEILSYSPRDPTNYNIRILRPRKSIDIWVGTGSTKSWFKRNRRLYGLEVIANSLSLKYTFK